MDTIEINNRNTLELNNTQPEKKNHSVQAGAGAGKTTMFSKRICKQILNGTPIEEFVVVTYTNAAAAELREKITRELSSIANNPSTDAKSREYATNALNSIEFMQVSTIHSFLFKILKENAFDTGVVVGCQMLDDNQDYKRKLEFFNEWYRKNSNRINNEFGKWEYVSSNGKRTNYTYEVFKNMFVDIANVRGEIVYDKRDDYQNRIDQLASNYVKQWKSKVQTIKESYDSIRPIIQKTGELLEHNSAISNIYHDMEMIVSGSCESEDIAIRIQRVLNVCYELIFEKDCKFFDGRRKEGKEANVKIADSFSSFSKDDDYDFDTPYNNIRVAWVVSYAVEVQKEYQAAIDKETLVLSNDDILYRADKLLSSRLDVLDRLRDKYSKIYVDEFQDTTRLQTSIIKLLAGKKGTLGEPWELEDDKLIIVGDPKQSIYRFTGAEKSIFDDLNKQLEAPSMDNADALTLSANFRSNQDIIDWVNDKYKVLIPDYVPMTTDWAVSEQNALHGVYRWNAELYDLKEDINAVVELVSRLVNNDKYFIEEISRNNSGIVSRHLRKIRYSDIMIMTEITTKLSGYVEALGAAGIPVNVNGKIKVTGDVILNNFYKLVKYLTNRKNKLNVAEAISVVQGVDIANISKESFSAYAQSLNDIISDAQTDPASQLQYLLSQEHLYLPHDIGLSVNEVRMYKIRLHQMVETCLSNSDNNMRSVADTMAMYLENVISRENPLESDEDAVRLMNVHKAKGLTANVVIIAERRRPLKVRSGAFRKGEKYYPAVNISFTADNSCCYPSYAEDENLMAINAQEEMDEAIRLQYVAATRAAHALIFMSPQADGVWFSEPEYALQDAKVINEWLDDRDKDQTVYSLKDDTNSSSHAVLKISDLESKVTDEVISSLGTTTVVSITPSSLEFDMTSGYKSGEDGYVKEDRPGNNVFGDVFHRTCEMIINRWKILRSLSEDELDKAITRIINQAILEKEELRKDSDIASIADDVSELSEDDSRQKYLDYLKDVFITRDYIGRVLRPIIDGHEEIYTEYEFGFYVPDSERDWFLSEFDEYLKASRIIIPEDAAIYINGKADLIASKDSKIAIYDYKSDSCNGKSLADFSASAHKKYEGQMKLYRYAMSKTFECDINAVAEAVLLHLYL